MRTLFNRSSSTDLVLILHGQYGSLEQPLVRNIFERLKDLRKKVVLFEFSYVKKGMSLSTDQILEANEVKNFLKTQKYKNLTIITHSNSIFVTLILWETGMEINNVILLGFPMMQSKDTPKDMAEMLKNILKQGNAFIIHAEHDEHAPLTYVRKFLQKYKLKIKLLKLPGNHQFKGFEKQVRGTIEKLLQ